MMAVLHLQQVSKTFGGVAALSNVDLELDHEVHALVGENGAGKSTLVKVIAGAIRPDSGTILMNGSSVQHWSPQAAQRSGIAVVYQEFNLLPALTVAENVWLGHMPRSRLRLLDTRGARQATTALFERLGADIPADVLVGALGVADQQIVEIAKALALDARILVLDEPSAVLNLPETERLLGVIRSLRSEGVTVLYISHRIDEVFEVGDRVTVLKDGRVICTKRVTETSRQDLVQLMVGRPITQQFPERRFTPGGALLEVRDLSAEDYVRNVSFDLRQGEILGVAGLNGSGRTTLARALVGLTSRTGQVKLRGRLLRADPVATAGAGMVLVPEDRKQMGLMLDRSVRFNVTLPTVRRFCRFGFIDSRKMGCAAASAIEDFQIRGCSPETRAARLSGGNQQKVVLAKWLKADPSVVIFDEPTRGIDVGTKAELYRMIENLTHQGLGILLISSELPEVLGTCDRMLVMRQGRLVAQVTREEATELLLLEYASGLRKGTGARDRASSL
jgi:ABC-type sugar transport system ATPase subunit